MDSDQKTDRSGLPGWLLVTGVLGGATVYFGLAGDQVTATLVGVMLLAGLSGYRVGAFKLAGFFAGVAAATTFAPPLGSQLEPSCAQWLGTSGLMNRAVSIGSVGLGITLTAVVLVAVLSRRLLVERPRLTAWNRWIGFGLGGMQGTLIVLILIGGLLVVEPMAKKRVAARDADDAFGQAVAQQVVRITEQSRVSKVGPLLAAYNPFDHIPQLAQMQQGVRVVSDPERVNRLIEHPAMEQLKESPAVRTAIDSLVVDPEILQVLESGRPIDSQTAMSLMNNPSILLLLDDPSFLTEMSKIVSELDPELQKQLDPLK
jgi:uncharacterized membrane protein required for colicin V production